MNSYEHAAQPRAATRELTNAFMRSVYNWMSAGLGITAIISYTMLETELYTVFLTQTGFYALIGLWIGTLGMVFYLSAKIQKMSPTAATGLFLAYSGVMGVLLSVTLAMYTKSSVVGAFISSAGMFAAVSVYGTVTKRDLTSLGAFCFMGLIGLILAMLVNVFFLKSGQFGLVISIVGVLIFVGLTAYDTQKIKVMGETMPLNDNAAVRRGAIMGALTLYLDFINLFLFTLRILGSRE